MKVYIGIDWSHKKHDVRILNLAGITLAEFSILHSSEGFAYLVDQIRNLGTSPEDCFIAIECTYTLLIDFLWANGFWNIWVAPPNRVKAERKTYTSSGAKSDPGDAEIIANMVRTKRQLLQPWAPGTPLLRQIQVQVRHIGHLTQDIVRQTNRLRDVLLRYYPAAVSLFSALDTQISLHFLRNFPTPQEASALTWDAFRQFVMSHRYPRPNQLAARFAHLQQPHLQGDLVTAAMFRHITVQTADATLGLVLAKQHALRDLQALYRQHPLVHIFESLPGAGQYLAPALLAKFGEDTSRFSSLAEVQILAGTCPVTETSGKRRRVFFRRSCDHEFRTIMQQWARCSTFESPWAQMYFRKVRPQCDSENHAYRCLANRWLAVLWKLWKTNSPYDEDHHLKDRAKRLASKS